MFTNTGKKAFPDCFFQLPPNQLQKSQIQRNVTFKINLRLRKSEKCTNSQMNDFHKMYSFKIHLICSYSMNYWNCNIHENSIGIIGDFGTNWKWQEKPWILHDDLHKVYWIHLMKVFIQNTFIVSKLLEIWVHTLNTSHVASWFIIALSRRLCRYLIHLHSQSRCLYV